MYNTVLRSQAARCRRHTFYYSDYNFKGSKFYHDGRWPCCSGTLPQVAADYRLNLYFRERDNVFVNLYVPSTVRWKHRDAHVSLTQKSNYPFESAVQLEVSTSKPVEFAVNVRIPAWAEGASVAINGKRISESVSPQTFATIRRQWKTGDHIELELPLRLRLEPIDERHPQDGSTAIRPVGAVCNDRCCSRGDEPGIARCQKDGDREMAGGECQRHSRLAPVYGDWRSVILHVPGPGLLRSALRLQLARPLLMDQRP